MVSWWTLKKTRPTIPTSTFINRHLQTLHKSISNKAEINQILQIIFPQPTTWTTQSIISPKMLYPLKLQTSEIDKTKKKKMSVQYVNRGPTRVNLFRVMGVPVVSMRAVWAMGKRRREADGSATFVRWVGTGFRIWSRKWRQLKHLAVMYWLTNAVHLGKWKQGSS